MEKHNVRILVCTHKEGPVRDDDIYMPVQVGKSASTIDLGCQGDDVGDNISGKNKTYCELTGLYWAWCVSLQTPIAVVLGFGCLLMIFCKERSLQSA